MLSQKAILIVEDNCFLAMDLAAAVEELDGQVVGPVATAADALLLLDQHEIAGAVLDCQLFDRDVTPVVLTLVGKGVPLVIQTGTGVPAALAEAHPDLPLLMKPVKPHKVLELLLVEIRKSTSSSLADKEQI